MVRRHDTFWLLGALAFGLFALPWLVYGTGVTLLGNYAAGDAAAFYADFLGSLGSLRWHAWALLLGPLVLVALWVGLWRLTAARPGQNETPIAKPPPRERVEPHWSGE
jgi:hypothetical protein